MVGAGQGVGGGAMEGVGQMVGGGPEGGWVEL